MAKRESCGQSVLIAAALINLLSLGMQAQQGPIAPIIPINDVSPYLGNPVAHPEALSGLWETSNGHGGAFGIHLLLTTTVPGDVKTLHGATQSWQSLEVGIYERKGATLQVGEQNYFSDSPKGGNISYEDGRLKLHFAPRVSSDPSIDLDLVHDADGSWTGRFHRGTFDSDVQLRRPVPRGIAEVNSIVAPGWRIGGLSPRACILLNNRIRASQDGPIPCSYSEPCASRAVFPGRRHR